MVRFTDFTPEKVLGVWETGQRLHPIDRALSILSVVCPEMTWEALVGLSPGRRDYLLLQLHLKFAGHTLAGQAVCPHCTEVVEFPIDIEQLLSMQRDPKLDSDNLQTEWNEYVIRYRLPDSRDLATVIGQVDGLDARWELIRRCLCDVRFGSQTVRIEDLPEELLLHFGDLLDHSDPFANLNFSMQCPQCEQRWSVAFDILEFLWWEISSRARQSLQEVHTLAKSYGWSEMAILAMTPSRRRIYGQLILSGNLGGA